MWLNAQLAHKTRIKQQAELDARKIKEERNFLDTNFLNWIWWIWDKTKIKLLDLWIKTISDLEEKWIEFLKTNWIPWISIIAIEKFLKERKEKTNENKIKEIEEKTLDWKIEIKDEEVKDEIEEPFNV